MISPARASSIVQPFLVIMLGVFVIVLLYGFLSNDEYEEEGEFTVTFTYDCNRVLNERNFPGEVLQECLDLRDEIKRRNNH